MGEADGHDGRILGASLGDPARFSVVFDRHFADVHRFLTRRVGRDVADDLAAAVFVEAFVGRGSFDVEVASARPWLFGIATNLLRRHHRTEVRRLRAYARHGVDPVADDVTLLDHVDAVTDGPRIARALATLHKRDRDALLLYAWADLTYDEIAGALGVPVGTIRSRISRARHIMRSRLGDLTSVRGAEPPLLFGGELDG
jgi:RNA polymerase sigma-70 factor (ECF subfamily)